eukprot:1364359-Amorphochlora_amoeboformis.AAC.2
MDGIRMHLSLDRLKRVVIAWPSQPGTYRVQVGIRLGIGTEGRFRCDYMYHRSCEASIFLDLSCTQQVNAEASIGPQDDTDAK